jgi:glycosyltransferase involved in cell wall biosynthesis
MSRGMAAGLRRIVFWQPIVSPHQHDFLEALAAAVPCEVILAAESGLPAERVWQGWRHATHERVRVVDVSTVGGFSALAVHRGADSLHVFSGFFSHAIVWRAFRLLSTSSARFAILSEAPEQGLWTGWLKRARGRVLVRRWESRVDFVLAMGDVGARFFEAVGFPQEKIGLFGYYLAVPTEPWPPVERSADGIFRFVAAGQLIRRKGFDLLLAALAGVEGMPWRCDLYGDGPLRNELRRAAGRLRIADRIGFHTPLPNESICRAIAGSDCCVVPSRHDGWGMVVNEALIAGTPVVCSDGCGAAAMIDDPAAGMKVPSGRVGPLAEALQRSLSAGKISSDARRRVHAVAERFSPAAGVRLFLDRLESLGPTCR